MKTLFRYAVLTMTPLVLVVNNGAAADEIVSDNLVVEGDTIVEGNLYTPNHRYRIERGSLDGSSADYWYGAHTTVRRIKTSSEPEMWVGLGRFPWNIVTNVEFNAFGFRSRASGVYQFVKEWGWGRPQIINATTFTYEGNERNIEFYGYTDPEDKGAYFLWAKYNNPGAYWGKTQGITFTISNNKGIEDSFGSLLVAHDASNLIPLDTMMVNGRVQKVGIRQDNPVKPLHVGAEARFDDVIHANGKILVNPQGDIGMGMFVEGERPDDSAGNTSP